MNLFERLVPILFILFCIVYFPQTFSFSTDWRAYPQILLAILFILCISWLLMDIFFPKKKEQDSHSKIIFSRVILTAVLSLIYILMINIVGFYLMTMLFIPTLMYIQGVKNLKLLIGISICFNIFLYIGFSVVLGVPTPHGFLF